jgi:chitodextrinase
MNTSPRSLYVAALLAAVILPCATTRAYPQTSPACPPPATGVFTACYFNNVSLTGNPVFIRTDSQINFSWGKQSPDPSLSPMNFSARWQGNFVFSGGSYTFTAVASDGMRLYLDGNLILGRWSDQPPTTYTVSQTVSAGTHLVAVEYYDWNGTATAQLSWKSNTAPPPVPVISSFTAAPASVSAGQPVTLSWTVSGASALSLSNGIGDVTGQTTVIVNPAASAIYTLTASNAAGSSMATAAVTVSMAPDTTPPSVPILISAVARNANEVDIAWAASTDNVAVAGYQILRNGSVLGNIPASSLNYADTTVSANTTYSYAVKAYDAAGNYSAAGNALSVTTPGVSPPPGSCPPPATGAFTGCYYSNTTLSGNPAFVRTDNQINFYWGNESPDPSLLPLDFSARWQGNFMFSSGVYKFTLITSDGMRLYIDGNMVFSQWRDQSANMYVVSQSLSAGTHLIVVEYYEVLGGATAQVAWQNTSPASSGPVISSFTATPSSASPGQPVTLSWTVSGATAIAIDNGIGDVTARPSITVTPAGTTTYTLTATNLTGTSTAAATVSVASGVDTQPPTVPTLVSAFAASASEVDLQWTASTDNVAVAGYQISRNGSVIGTIAAPNLTYADTTVIAMTTYSYSVKAYDATLNYSAASNSLSATTPAGPSVTVTWYGACWQPATIYGVTGMFQAIDFQMSTSTPVPVQGTMFYAPHCDASSGTDNMNDFNALTPSTHMIQGFSHNPNEMPVSAVYWVGPRTADGMCAPGSPCSKCVEYNAATPNCNNMP